MSQCVPRRALSVPDTLRHRDIPLHAACVCILSFALNMD